MIRRLRDFDLTLNIKDEKFINPPQAFQKNWIIQRAIEEFVDDLKQLDKVSKSFIDGSERPQIVTELSKSSAYYNDDQLIIDGQQVMHNWAYPIMVAMANIVAETHGDVLEIGFGMGFSSSHIQNIGVKSHTIIECNNDVIEAFNQWKQQFPDRDIRLVRGKWQDVVDQLGTFDAIIFDTYPLSEDEFLKYIVLDVTFAAHFFEKAASLLRPGGVFTYYTNEIDSFSRRHQRKLFQYFSSITLQVVEQLEPPKDCKNWWADSMVVVKAVK